MSDPTLSPARKEALVAELMTARRTIAAAVRQRDDKALREARKTVDRVKRELGERGPGWWSDGAPDVNRRMAQNTVYAEWYAALPAAE